MERSVGKRLYRPWRVGRLVREGEAVVGGRPRGAAAAADLLRRTDAEHAAQDGPAEGVPHLSSWQRTTRSYFYSLPDCTVEATFGYSPTHTPPRRLLGYTGAGTLQLVPVGATKGVGVSSAEGRF